MRRGEGNAHVCETVGILNSGLCRTGGRQVVTRLPYNLVVKCRPEVGQDRYSWAEEHDGGRWDGSHQAYDYGDVGESLVLQHHGLLLSACRHQTSDLQS